MFCRPVIVCVLACITSTIQTTEGRMLVTSVSGLIHAEVICEKDRFKLATTADASGRAVW